MVSVRVSVGLIKFIKLDKLVELGDAAGTILDANQYQHCAAKHPAGAIQLVQIIIWRTDWR